MASPNPKTEHPNHVTLHSNRVTLHLSIFALKVTLADREEFLLAFKIEDGCN